MQSAPRNDGRHRTWPAYLSATAAIFAAVVLTFTNASLRSENASLHDRNDLLEQRERTEAMQRAAARRMLAALVAADATHFPVLDGDVVRYRSVVLIAMHRLALLPKGHVYQAWTRAHGSAVLQPSVTFSPDANGWAVVALPGNADGIEGVALSIEPDGGSKMPTTSPLFVRSLIGD